MMIDTTKSRGSASPTSPALNQSGEENSMLNFAVVQLGYCVFGVGETEWEAYDEAAQWMEGTDEDGEPCKMTPEMVEAECDNGRRNKTHGSIVLMDADHPEFDSYMSNQGGFLKTDDGWIVS